MCKSTMTSHLKVIRNLILMIKCKTNIAKIKEVLWFYFKINLDHCYLSYSQHVLVMAHVTLSVYWDCDYLVEQHTVYPL
jgi:hypothetical protein